MKKRTRILTTMSLSICLSAGMIIAGCGSANNASADAEATSTAQSESSSSVQEAATSEAEEEVISTSEDNTDVENEATEEVITDSTDAVSGAADTDYEGNERYAFYVNAKHGVGMLTIEEAEADEADGAIFAQPALDSFPAYKITANTPIKNVAVYDVSVDMEDRSMTFTAERFATPEMQTDQYLFMTDPLSTGMEENMKLIQWEDAEGTVYRRFMSASVMDGGLSLSYMGGFMNTSEEEAENSTAKIDTFEDGESQFIGERAIDEERLIGTLSTCLGWGGDSGSSLKAASATATICTYLVDHTSSNNNTIAVVEVLYAELDDEQRENLASNWKNYIQPNVKALMEKDSLTIGMMEDSGVDEETMQSIMDVIDAERYVLDWDSLDSIVCEVFGIEVDEV